MSFFILAVALAASSPLVGPLEHLTPLVGDWSCMGDSIDPVTDAHTPSPSAVTMHSALEGHWLAGTLQEYSVLGVPTFATASWIAADPRGGFVQYEATSEGNMNLSHSAGIDASGTLTWQGTLAYFDDRSHVSYALRLMDISASGFRSEFSVADKEGVLRAIYTGRCRRD